MTSKHASNHRRGQTRSFLSLAGGALAVLVICVAARSFWGPDTAPAQVSAKRGTTARTTTATARDQAQAPQQKVVANVNGQSISRDALAVECLRRYGKDVLESIVNKHLIWQECKKRNVIITDQDVENEIEQNAGEFGLPKDGFLNMLATKRDISPDRYRRELIWPTLALRRLATNQIVVTEEELRKAFDTEYGPRVKARMIVTTTKAKAEEALRRVEAAPAKFGDVAKELSEDPNTAAARGIIPPIRKHVGYPELERVAFTLKKGDISPIIPVANQYIILMCERQIGPNYVSSKELPRIQERLRERIRDNKLREVASDLFEKLQADAKVVNVYNDPRLKQQMPGVAATINGRQIPMRQLSEECVVRYGKEVLEGEINRAILAQELKRQSKTITQQAIDEEIARAADAYGHFKQDGSPDVQAWLEAVTENDHVTIDLYVHDAVWPSVALKQLVHESIQVTQEDLKKGFESNYGERVEVLAIVLTNQRQAGQVWEMARDNPTDDYFGELASQYSIEQVSRANFGKVPPIRRYGGQPVIEDEAFKLTPGGVESLSGILNVGDKYVILKCLGRTKPVVKDFNAVRNELYKDIHEKKLRIAMADEFDRLKESARIDNFLAGTTQSGRKIGPRPARGRGVSAATFQQGKPR